MFRSLRVRLALSHAFVMLVILTIFAGLVLLLLALQHPLLFRTAIRPHNLLRNQQ